MSEERDAQAAGAPVEEAEPTSTEVLAAVERAAEVPVTASTAPSAADAAVATTPDTSTGADAHDAVGGAPAANAPASDDTMERPVIAPAVEPPSAAAGPSASEIFAAAGSHSSAAQAQATAGTTGASAGTPGIDGLAERLEADRALAAGAVAPAFAAAPPTAPAAAPADQPAVAPAAAPLPPVRDGEIRISADHPMAALYMQTPMPPEIRGNRGAGVLIALLATVGFAVVYAGVLALWLAPTTPPSRFVTTLLDAGLWPLVAASAAFLVGLSLLVLVVGRAGWWAYILGGFLVGVFVWGATVLGAAFAVFQFSGGSGLTAAVGGSLTPLSLIQEFGLLLPVIAAGIVAREATVWFGAWIGARGRKVTRKNAEAVAEYEAALAEVQAKQP